jgi:PAS domain S-box-containing protein
MPTARPLAKPGRPSALRYRAAIVEGAHDAIIGEDLNGRVTSWNLGAEKLFGFSAAQAMGQVTRLLLRLKCAAAQAAPSNTSAPGWPAGSFEAEWCHESGGQIPVSVVTSPIHDQHGQVAGTSLIARDITNQKTEARTIVEALASLTQQNEEESRRTAALLAANHEKAQRAAELLIANKELAFQNEEKAKRVAELLIANSEKAKRAAELVIANREKTRRAADLAIAQLKAANSEKLHVSLMETIDLARQLIELRDPYTAGHEKQVGDLAKAIARKMGFDEHEQERLMIAGYLHDLGKIVVPVEILCRPGKLSDEEYALVKTHVQASHDLIQKITFPWEIARSILEHHERLDGSGYPHQLRDAQISMQGRILAVADVVDAMASHRPYRPAPGIALALDEIERGQGKLYDETVVQACLALFHKDAYRLHADG